MGRAAGPKLTGLGGYEFVYEIIMGNGSSIVLYGSRRVRAVKTVKKYPGSFIKADFLHIQCQVLK